MLKLYNLKKSQFIRFIFFCCVGSLCLLDVVQASERKTIEVLHSDIMSQRVFEGQTVRILQGNVELKQDEIIMKCDSAVQFTGRNELEAYGNIHIRQGDSLHLYGEQLFYDGNERKAIIENNVRMVEDEMELTTSKLYYEVDEGKAYYYDFAEITHGDDLLTSYIGYYFSEAKNFEFQDSVRLDNPDFLLKSDTLHYEHPASLTRVFGPTIIERKESTDYLYCERGWFDTENEEGRVYGNPYLWHEYRYIEADTMYVKGKDRYAKTIGNITVKDTAENLNMHGHFAEHFDDMKYTYITDSASARQVFEEDTIWIAADTLSSAMDDSMEFHLFRAFNNVRSFNHDFQTTADSMVYTEYDSMLTLYHDPRLFLDSQQISADTISAKFDGEHLTRMNFLREAFMISPVGYDFYNQIKGRTMTGHFRENELRQIEVSGNAESVYFLKDDDERFIGVNRIEATDINIMIGERQIQDITFLREPDATVYPMGELEPGELLLRGFNWNPEIIPHKPADLFKEQFLVQ